MMTPPDAIIIRRALATRAYRTNTVRLADPDLSPELSPGLFGATHVVATRDGLFVTDGRALSRIAYGMFYGVTIQPHAILAFEACDRPHARTGHGRIVRFAHAHGRIVATDIVARGLDNGCHQIDLIHGRLCVTDTYNQRVLRFAGDGGMPEILYPLGPAAPNDWAGGYAHVNSLIAHGDEILLLLHNGADRTARPSEVLRLTRDWRPIARAPLDGLGCHGFAILEDDTVLTCGSFAGELVSTDGFRVKVCDMMTRGLSVGDTDIVVGGSAFAGRDARDSAAGALFFLDRDYRVATRLEVPAPVMEIRRLDGRDRSLSAHVARDQACLTNTNSPYDS